MMLLTLRGVMGISESLFMLNAIALTASAHTPEHRSRAIAALTTAQIVGTAAGSWFGGWMADRGQWRGAFFILGAVDVLCAPCLHALGSSDTLDATRIAADAFGLFSGLLMGNIFPAAFEVVPSATRVSAVSALFFRSDYERNLCANPEMINNLVTARD